MFAGVQIAVNSLKAKNGTAKKASNGRSLQGEINEDLFSRN